MTFDMQSAETFYAHGIRCMNEKIKHQMHQQLGLSFYHAKWNKNIGYIFASIYIFHYNIPQKVLTVRHPGMK